MTLLIRTDQPEAEIYLYDGMHQVGAKTWHAHRQLSETIHHQIEQLLKTHQFDWASITSVGSYQGPGSFTGLRIGLTVANSLANSLNIPVVTAKGDAWVDSCLGKLSNGEDQKVVTPEYGRTARITQQKK